jgi:hypothetical protein
MLSYCGRNRICWEKGGGHFSPDWPPFVSGAFVSFMTFYRSDVYKRDDSHPGCHHPPVNCQSRFFIVLSGAKPDQRRRHTFLMAVDVYNEI